MGLVMSAATGSGWTTGSGMEGPPMAGGAANLSEVSTLPWSLFTKSPWRRMRVAFTCNVCGQRTTCAINPHAYTDGTLFVQVTIGAAAAAVPVGGAAAASGGAAAVAPKGNLHQTQPHNRASRCWPSFFKSWVYRSSRKKNPEEKPHPSMCFSSLEIVTCEASYVYI